MAHETVLLNEAVDALSLSEGSIIVDGTLGSAGHATLITKQLGASGTFIGIDHDSDALSRSKLLLEKAGCTKHFIEGNFRDISTHLKKLEIKCIDGLLLDLGLNSEQLESSNRGFSFQKNEPLSMTFSADSSKSLFTAETILNEWKEEHLFDVIKGYGEERFAKSIARKIIEARQEKKFKTTDELVDVIKGAVPTWYRHKKIHPATKTFQALRITVNDEIESLKQGLTDAYTHLNDNGRIVVISFHSIEDRVVKHLFHSWEKEDKGIRITKKPLTPTDKEKETNPRSRSAKLRVFEKHVHTSTQKKE